MNVAAGGGENRSTGREGWEEGNDALWLVPSWTSLTAAGRVRQPQSSPGRDGRLTRLQFSAELRLLCLEIA